MTDPDRADREASRFVTDFVRRTRHLPHWEDPGAMYFITFTLADRGLCDLTSGDIAPIIIGALRYFNGERYDLYEYVVMPDHVHAILKLPQRGGRTEALHRVMHSIKSWTAKRINERLGRTGRLWRDETYDHIIRDPDDYENHAGYIWLNPLAKGLTGDPDRWPWFGDGQAAGGETDDDLELG